MEWKFVIYLVGEFIVCIKQELQNFIFKYLNQVKLNKILKLKKKIGDAFFSLNAKDFFLFANFYLT